MFPLNLLDDPRIPPNHHPNNICQSQICRDNRDIYRILVEPQVNYAICSNAVRSGLNPMMLKRWRRLLEKRNHAYWETKLARGENRIMWVDIWRERKRKKLCRDVKIRPCETKDSLFFFRMDSMKLTGEEGDASRRVVDMVKRIEERMTLKGR